MRVGFFDRKMITRGLDFNKRNREFEFGKKSSVKVVEKPVIEEKKVTKKQKPIKIEDIDNNNE